MAAVLACGDKAVLSDESSGCLFRFWEKETRGIEVTVPRKVTRRPSGILVHKRLLLPGDRRVEDRIPVMSPNATLGQRFQGRLLVSNPRPRRRDRRRIAHASAIKQTEDRRRDQAHTAAGLTQLRFTHYQVRFEPKDVETVLARVAGRLELTLGR